MIGGEREHSRDQLLPGSSASDLISTAFSSPVLVSWLTNSSTGYVLLPVYFRYGRCCRTYPILLRQLCLRQIKAKLSKPPATRNTNHQYFVSMTSISIKHIVHSPCLSPASSAGGCNLLLRHIVYLIFSREVENPPNSSPANHLP